MDTVLGMFGGGGEGFTPFSESRAQEHYRDLYLSEQPKHEASLTHEGECIAFGASQAESDDCDGRPWTDIGGV